MPLYSRVSKLLDTVKRASSRSSPRASAGSERTTVSDVRLGIPGRLPSRFRVREKLGQGGMGVVFRAHDAERGHDVALKSLTRLHPDDLYRLKAEFRALARIRHPNLVDLYELFVDEAEGFFTMELVDGSDFLGHVRTGAGGRCDYDRLREAARQLALAIRAVHAAGKLHRDIKPSNVRVSRSDRVVLLDFGLVDALSPEVERTEATGALVGTIEYMPPEQARGEALGPSADWYSFGVTLFEAISGELPLNRPLQWLLGDGKKGSPRRLRDFVPDVPADLDEMVTSLLARDAESRGKGADVLRALAGDSSPVSVAPPAFSEPRLKALFVDRESDLAGLLEAFEEVKRGHTVIARIHGASGVGKTELVRHFMERCERDGALVLCGRCHPNEWLAFNALDGVVDDLSRTLERWSDEQVRALLPRRVSQLVRLFPVLGRVPAVGEADESREGTAHDALRGAALALKELLANLADHTPLVLWLDDVQWGDQDSGNLLMDLLSSPDTPRCLVVMSYRSGDASSSRMLDALRGGRSGFEVVDVDLPLMALNDVHSFTLVERLAGDAFRGGSDEVRRLAREADGLPFFLLELARFLTQAPDAAAVSALRLSDLLEQRVSSLSDEKRAVLAVVSVFGGPVEQRLLVRAAGTKQAVYDALAFLEQASLVRSSTIDGMRAWEVYHHRIRDAVISQLEDVTRRGHHHAIADAILSVEEPNLSQAVEHYELSLDLEAVRKYVVAAARRAADSLAFARAAELYRRAIELGGTELTEHQLHERLGDALANAGRGAEGGRALERAADLAESAGCDPEETVHLRRRAATEYLRSWQREEAMRVLGIVAKPLGIAVPRGVGSALVEAVVNRMSIALRRSTPLEASAPRRTVERLDVLEMLMKVAANTEPVMGFAFGSRLLKEALDAKDPDLVFRGLCCEGVAWAAVDKPFAQRRADSHMRRAEELLGARPNPLHHAWFLQCQSHVSHFRGDFKKSLAEMSAALERYRALRRAYSIDYSNALAFHFPTLALLGKLKTLRGEMDALLSDAESRGDAYVVAASAAGNASLGFILGGRVADARRWAERVRSLAPPRFSTQHYLHVVALVHIALCEDRGADAFATIEQAWPDIVRSRFLDVAVVGDDLRALRGRAAIAAAVQRRAAGEVGHAEPLLALAESDAVHIEQDGTGYAAALAKLLHAGVRATRGDRGAARLALAEALASFDAQGVELYASACRYAASTTGSSERDRAVAWMDAEGVVDRDALLRTCAPGCAF